VAAVFVLAAVDANIRAGTASPLSLDAVRF